MVANIDRQQLLQLIDDGGVVIDVLPPAEYRSSHIPGAVSIPLRSLNEASTQSIPRDKPVAVY